MNTTNTINWQEAGKTKTGIWHSENAAPVPKKVQIADDTIKAEANKAYGDWSGNYFIVRPVDGKFTEVSIDRDQYKAIKNQ